MIKRLAHDIKIGTLVGFHLQMVSLRLNEVARIMLADYAISPAKVTALSLIDANPGCEQSALGRELSINRASAMKLVNWLAERGLVERRPGRDLRSNALHLTETGEIQLREMIDRLRLSEEGVLRTLGAQEQTELLRLLKQLHREKPQRQG
ncbi:MAG: MarR family transcriptional regulator [Sphingobium sp.]